MDEVNRPNDNNMLYKHPADFILYEIGTFDQNIGAGSFLSTPFRLTGGDEIQTPS